MRSFIVFLLIFMVGVAYVHPVVLAQSVPDNEEVNLLTDEPELSTDEADLLATESAAIASPSAEQQEKLEIIKKENITQPEETETKSEFLQLFGKRPIERLSLINFMGYAVQFAVRSGVPANTVILILLLPFLATVAAFCRHIVGLPTLGIIVPVALSITLLATGITAGGLLLATILIGSFIARLILKRVRIMHMPKMALSIFMISICVFILLVVAVLNNLLVIRQLSIFPVLLLILLSERIIALQIDRKLWETSVITLTNLALGVVGFLILSAQGVRESVLLYPELILLLIPINVAIGRYFGLRLVEYFRFKTILEHHGR